MEHPASYQGMEASVKLRSVGNQSEAALPLTLLLDTRPVEKVIYGYALPAVILVTVILNLFAFSTLTKKTMRSSVNIILAALAVSDTMTGLAALPYYVYFYSRETQHNYIPYHWCYVQKLTAGILPTVFHTASVWLTVALAVQRYIYLCHSLKAKTLCTNKRATHTVVMIMVAAFAFHLPRLFDSTFVEVTLDLEGQAGHVDTCAEVVPRWVMDYQHVYYPLYYWSRVTLINIVPSLALVVLNITLVNVMKTTNRRRRLLIIQNRSTEWKRLRETNITTFMLTVVVSIFLLVEIPTGMLILLVTLKSQCGLSLFADDDTMKLIKLTFNFLVLLSYPLNFFVYVFMSKKFRTEMYKLLCTVRKVDNSAGTMQTSREKSSSMELVKTMFTVMAVPNGTERARGVPGQPSSSSSASSVSGSQRRKSSEETLQYDLRNPTCRCSCQHCIERCQKPRNYVNVSTYVDDLKMSNHQSYQ